MGTHRDSGSRHDGSRHDGSRAFDIALWGYDRRQVDRCLDDLTTRLEDAVRQLDSVDVLYTQLCQAQLEADQLRNRMVTGATEHPEWSDRLATIMAAAEQLWSRAARDAESIRPRSIQSQSIQSQSIESQSIQSGSTESEARR